METAARIGLWFGLLVAASFLAPTAPAAALETTGSGQTDTGFVDVEEGPHAQDIRFIVDRGLTIGCDAEGPRYCPGRDVTRAEIAIFLARALRLDTTLSYRGVFTDVPRAPRTRLMWKSSEPWVSPIPASENPTGPTIRYCDPR